MTIGSSTSLVPAAPQNPTLKSRSNSRHRNTSKSKGRRYRGGSKTPTYSVKEHNIRRYSENVSGKAPSKPSLSQCISRKNSSKSNLPAQIKIKEHAFLQENMDEWGQKIAIFAKC